MTTPTNTIQPNIAPADAIRLVYADAQAAGHSITVLFSATNLVFTVDPSISVDANIAAWGAVPVSGRSIPPGMAPEDAIMTAYSDAYGTGGTRIIFTATGKTFVVNPAMTVQANIAAWKAAQ